MTSSIMTNPISVANANRLHSNFMSHSSPNSDVKAVLFKYDELGSLIQKVFNLETMIDLPGAGFYCYFGRYDNSDGAAKANKNTIIIHFAEPDGTSGDWKIIPDEIYNFGDPCPTKCPKNKQIN